MAQQTVNGLPTDPHGGGDGGWSQARRFKGEHLVEFDGWLSALVNAVGFCFGYALGLALAADIGAKAPETSPQGCGGSRQRRELWDTALTVRA